MVDQQLLTAVGALHAEAVKTRAYTEELVALMREQNNLTSKALKYIETPVRGVKQTDSTSDLHLRALTDLEWEFLFNFVDLHSREPTSKIREWIDKAKVDARSGYMQELYYE